MQMAWLVFLVIVIEKTNQRVARVEKTILFSVTQSKLHGDQPLDYDNDNDNDNDNESEHEHEHEQSRRDKPA